jgi:hypothetical protein
MQPMRPMQPMRQVAFVLDRAEDEAKPVLCGAAGLSARSKGRKGSGASTLTKVDPGVLTKS